MKMDTIKENNGIHLEKVTQGKSRKPKEPLAELMGEIGKWQLWRIAIVFWLGIPGIAHVFSAAFIAAKTDYWCKDDLPRPRFNLDDRLNYTLDTLPFGIPANKNACNIGCKSFGYDHSFWYSTIIMQWDLVCEWSYLSGKINSSFLYEKVFPNNLYDFNMFQSNVNQMAMNAEFRSEVD